MNQFVQISRGLRLILLGLITLLRISSRLAIKLRSESLQFHLVLSAHLVSLLDAFLSDAIDLAT